MASALKVVHSPNLTVDEEKIERCEKAIDAAETIASDKWMIEVAQMASIKSAFSEAKKGKRQPPFGMKSYRKYCESNRCRFQPPHATRMAQAGRILPLLPKALPTGNKIPWTERSVRPLSKLKSDRTIESAAKIAAKDTKTKSLARAVVDVVAKRRLIAPKAPLTPAANIKRLLGYTEKHLVALTTQPKEFWDAVEAEEPGIAARAAVALEQLAAALRR